MGVSKGQLILMGQCVSPVTRGVIACENCVCVCVCLWCHVGGSEVGKAQRSPEECWSINGCAMGLRGSPD